MIAVTHIRVEPGDADRFAASAREAIDAFSRCAGYLRGWLGRCTDDPADWVIGSEWAGVGFYRRALGSHDVRMLTTEVFGGAVDAPSAFEILYTVGEKHSPSDVDA